MNTQIKKAFESAEKEIQDKEIAQFKKIILNLLEKKRSKEEEKSELEKEIKIIKSAIYDFKEGRIDKVKEMLDKDSFAKTVLPIQITIVQNDIYHTYPLNPWRWNYQMAWAPISTTSLLNYNLNAGWSSNNVLGQMSSTTSLGNQALCSLTGTTASNFTSGTYNLSNGGGIINL